MSKLQFIIIGAGCRGRGYADIIAQHHGTEAEIIGVAEPRDWYRNNLAARYDIPPAMRFRDWRELITQSRLADAVIIATPDHDHVDPCVTFAQKGYHIILEKPMAPHLEDCEKIVATVKQARITFAVCHVLRYTPYTIRLKQLLNSGRIGNIVNVQHLEPVGFWHQAHSFVRGNWRNEKESSFMLLAKSCHDLDWLSYIVGKPCHRVSSFGGLRLFRPENRPLGAAERCTSCRQESQCPYSAVKIYWRDRAARNLWDWPVNVLTPESSRAALFQALEEGPYGRCVYACDNDVVDNQIVNFEFEDGTTANFTMTAFTPAGQGRQTKIFGTAGYIYGDSSTIQLVDFLSETPEEIDISKEAEFSVNNGHGGGDEGLIAAFITALRTGNRQLLTSGPDATIESHRMVFAAERSRHSGRTEKVELKHDCVTPVLPGPAQDNTAAPDRAVGIFAQNAQAW